MLVLLMTSGSTLPPELAEDVFLMDEPLPSADHRCDIRLGGTDGAGRRCAWKGARQSFGRLTKTVTSIGTS